VTFLEDLAAENSDASITDFAEVPYAAVTIFGEIARGIDGPVDAASFLAAVSGLATPVETGLVAPFIGGTAPGPVEDSPSVKSININEGVILDGAPVLTAAFIDPLAELEAIGAGG
jgi:hypothetical protein